MSTGQATFFMKWLQKDANSLAAKEADDEALARIGQCNALMGTISENMHSLVLYVLRCDTAVVRIERKRVNGNWQPKSWPTQQGQPKTMDAASAPPSRKNLTELDLHTITGQLDAQQRVIQMLCGQLAEGQRAADAMTQNLTILSDQKTGDGSHCRPMC